MAVDSYVWLHKGIVSCAIELGLGTPTTKYIDYCKKRVNMFLSNNISVVMIFDGSKLPSKGNTEVNREKRREEAKSKAMEYYKAGEHEMARKKFESIDLTPEMAMKLY